MMTLFSQRQFRHGRNGPLVRELWEATRGQFRVFDVGGNVDALTAGQKAQAINATATPAKNFQLRTQGSCFIGDQLQDGHLSHEK